MYKAYGRIGGSNAGMKKIYQFTVFCVMLAVAVVHGQELGHEISVQAAVRMNQKEATICIGGKTTLEVNGATYPVKWSTSNKKVARVGSAGVVTGVRKGTAIITAKTGGKVYECQVMVNETYGAGISDISLKREASVMLTFTKDAVVSYKIQDPDICSADWGGWSGNEIPLNITPKKVGSTYITCTNSANSETVRIRVRVKKFRSILRASSQRQAMAAILSAGKIPCRSRSAATGLPKIQCFILSRETETQSAQSSLAQFPQGNTGRCLGMVTTAMGPGTKANFA